MTLSPDKDPLTFSILMSVAILAFTTFLCSGTTLLPSLAVIFPQTTAYVPRALKDKMVFIIKDYVLLITELSNNVT